MATEIWANIGSGNGLFAWQHQAITWTNFDWSSAKSNDIRIRAISQEMSQPSITEIRLKITYLKFHYNFPGTIWARFGASVVRSHLHDINYKLREIC